MSALCTETSFLNTIKYSKIHILSKKKENLIFAGHSIAAERGESSGDPLYPVSWPGGRGAGASGGPPRQDIRGLAYYGYCVCKDSWVQVIS